MTNHESGNRVIAEFEGYEYCGGTWYRKQQFATKRNWTKKLDYHTSLDSLKYVIDKFLSIPIETFNYDAKAMAEFRMVRASLANMPISKSLQDFYNELLTAINWYNTQKTLTND